MQYEPAEHLPTTQRLIILDTPDLTRWIKTNAETAHPWQPQYVLPESSPYEPRLCFCETRLNLVK